MFDAVRRGAGMGPGRTWIFWTLVAAAAPLTLLPPVPDVQALLAVLAAVVAWCFVSRLPPVRPGLWRIGRALLVGWGLCSALGELSLGLLGRRQGGVVAASAYGADDVWFLAAIACGAVGVLCVMFAVYDPISLVRAALDGWVVAGSIGALVLGIVYPPALPGVWLSEPALAQRMAFLVLDAALCAVLVGVAANSRGASRLRSGVAAFVVAMFVLRDVGLLFFLTGDDGWLRVAQLAAWLGYALVLPTTSLGQAPERLGTHYAISFGRRFTLPSALAATAGVLLVSVVLRDGKPTDAVFLLVLSVIVALVLRHAIALRDNAALVRELAASEDHFRSLVLGSTDVIVVTTAQGVIRYASPAAEPLLGRTARSLIDLSVLDLVHPDDARAVQREVLTVLQSRQPRAWVQARLRAGDGSWRSTESSVSPFEVGLIGNVRDVTERVRLQEQLHHLAFYDALTDLPNRVMLTEQIDAALRRVPRGQCALMFLDLDGFKTVNDSAGHDAGDSVLVEIAARLRAAVPESSVVSRFGGDEFAVLLPQAASPEVVERSAEQLSAALAAPFDVGGRLVVVPASIGIAYAEPGLNAARLLRNADLAMYAAKAQGGPSVRTYHSGLLDRAVAQADLSALLAAVPDERSFALLYQPVVALDEGRLVGVEALIRWRSADGDLMTPAELLALAESSGQMQRLGRWVLDEALSQAARWWHAGDEIDVAVNLSVSQLSTPGLEWVVAEALQAHRVPPHALTLEITESVLLEDIDEGVMRLRALKALGVRLALDDFGTGYSSLGYLARLPLDVVKLDRSMVSRLGADPQSEAVLAAAVRLGRDLGLSVVAEGVETLQQLEVLQRLHCPRAQGYVFSGPLDAAGISRLLRAGSGAFARRTEMRTSFSPAETHQRVP